jgi:hypothetical protein
MAKFSRELLGRRADRQPGFPRCCQHKLAVFIDRKVERCFGTPSGIEPDHGGDCRGRLVGLAEFSGDHRLIGSHSRGLKAELARERIGLGKRSAVNIGGREGRVPPVRVVGVEAQRAIGQFRPTFGNAYRSCVARGQHQKIGIVGAKRKSALEALALRFPVAFPGLDIAS